MDIIERIKKLYNLSTRNSCTAEAAAAAAKIQELCFQHELDLAKILEQSTDPATPYVRYDYLLPETCKADVGWKRSLFYAITKGNFCQSVYLPGTTKMACIGQKHNYEAVVYTYEYLTREIQRLAVDACIKQGFLVSKDKKQYIAGFCEGAMSECYRKLTQAMTERSAATVESRALVVVKNKDLETATKVHFPKLIHRGRRLNGSIQGRNDGHIAGRGISIHRGVSGNGNGRTAIG